MLERLLEQTLNPPAAVEANKDAQNKKPMV